MIEPTEILETFFSKDLTQSWMVDSSLDLVAQDAWKGGYEIANVAYYKKNWVLTAIKPARSSTQVIVQGGIFPQDDVKARLETGYRVFSLANGGGTWAIAMTKTNGSTAQTIFTRGTSEVAKEIDEQWDLGYRVTALAYGKGVWAVCMTKTDDGASEVFMTRVTSELTAAIQGKWDEGYLVSAIGYGDGRWAVVMTDKGSWASQTLMTRLTSELPYSVKGQWDLGYRVTGLAYGEGMWALVTSKPH